MSLRGIEKVRTFMDKLTATTNVSKYIDLPMIVVMGDTSSGESSLSSSLSTVELPSASERTTRCPIMLQMKCAQEKRAVVSLQWKDIPDGKLEKGVKFGTVHVDGKAWKFFLRRSRIVRSMSLTIGEGSRQTHCSSAGTRPYLWGSYCCRPPRYCTISWKG